MHLSIIYNFHIIEYDVISNLSCLLYVRSGPIERMEFDGKLTKRIQNGAARVPKATSMESKRCQNKLLKPTWNQHFGSSCFGSG